MPLREIVVGRDEEDREKYGKKGTIYFGKHLVGEGEEANLTNPVHLDVARPHVSLICGKRGSGKCLLPQEKVQMADGELKEIESVYQENKDNGEKEIDKEEEELVELQKCPEVVSLDENLTSRNVKVSHLYRKRVEEKIIKLRTRTGKEIKVTEEHPLLTSNLNWKEASKINEGEHLAVPTKTKIEGEKQKLKSKGEKVDYSLWSQEKAKILTMLSERGEIKAREVKDSFKFDPYRQLTKLSGQGLVKSRTNSPTKYSLTRSGQEFAENIDKGEFYRARDSSKPIKLPEGGRKLSRFIAYLLAEGTEEEMPNSFRFVFTNNDEAMKSDFCKISKDLFSLRPKDFPDNRAVYFDSLNLKDFLEKNGYACGKKSRGKRIPSFIMMSSKDEVSQFLRTYFDCEGCVSSDTPQIELSSASEEIISQISYLLLRFGITSIVKKKMKHASNTENKTKREYYVLKISGRDSLAKFKKEIGFGMERKSSRLDKFLDKEANTNIDVIPNSGERLRRVRELLEMDRTEMGVKKQSMKAYEEGKYNPSKQFLAERLKDFKNRREELRKLYREIQENGNPELLVKAVDKTSLEWSKINKELGTTYSGREILNYTKKGSERFEKIKEDILQHLGRIIENRKLEELLKELDFLVRSDVFWDKVVSVEEIDYSGWVYDLTVPETHNFLAGRNGGTICHNSYTGAVVAEEFFRLPDEVRNNLSMLMIDTMGIWWSLKNPNEKQLDLLKEWDLEPRDFDANVYVPEGFQEDYSEADIPFDDTFSIKAADLSAEDWSLAFGISLVDPLGILLERVMRNINEEMEDYGMGEIIEAIRNDERASQEEKDALENRFLSAQEWGIFSREGLSIQEILSPGKVSVLDISYFGHLSRGWSVRGLLVGLLSRRIYRARVKARRREEVSTIRGTKEMKIPLTWVVMDEAHQFLPAEGKTPASDPLITLVKQGRQPGISTIFITQRPNKIHPDAISQADIVVSHRLTARPDLEALRNIMQTYMTFDIKEYINDLPRKKGSAIILDDNSERLYSMKVRPRMSWHAGGTPIAFEEEEEF